MLNSGGKVFGYELVAAGCRVQLDEWVHYVLDEVMRCDVGERGNVYCIGPRGVAPNAANMESVPLQVTEP